MPRVVLADDPGVSRSVIDDASGKLTISDVVRRLGTPAADTAPAGGKDAVEWVRLQIQPQDVGGKTVLLVHPATIREVRLYEAEPGDPMHWKYRVTGGEYSSDQRDQGFAALHLRDRDAYGFLVNVPGGGATYYLRIDRSGNSPSDASGGSPIGVEVVDPIKAVLADHQLDLLAVLFVTSMLSLLFWAIHTYLADRRRLVALFAVHQAVYTLFGVVAMGSLAPLAPGNVPRLDSWIYTVCYLAINFTPLLFCRELFKPYGPPKGLMHGLNVLLISSPALLVALILGRDALAVQSNTVLIEVSWLYFAIVAFSLRVESEPKRRVLRLFFVLLLAINQLFRFVNHGGQPTPQATLISAWLLIVYGLVVGGFFAIILHADARRTQKDAQQANMDLLMVQKMYELEQELKKQNQVQAQTDHLTGMNNRRHFIETAERELTRASRFQSGYTLLVMDIDHFKKINDTWGHRAGDLVLQKVAKLVENNLRNVDIFGRTGGEEFAAVIVEKEGEDALKITERLCASVANATIVAETSGRIPVTISIGLTQLCGRNIDFQSLMHEADLAMYEAKQAGRNRVVVSPPPAAVDKSYYASLKRLEAMSDK